MRVPSRRVLIAVAASGALGLSVTITGVAAASDASSIAEIQGAAHVSPLAGEQVTDIPGIVTAVSEDGFWMQSAEPSDDEATSDAIFVYTGDAPDVSAGDSVTISGTVSEFRPGDEESNLSITQITEPDITADGTADLPEPALIGPGGLEAPDVVHSGEPGDVENADFDPSANALDFYESLEGMLVRVSDAEVVGPTSQHGETPVLPGGEGGQRTERGGVKLTAEDENTERVILGNAVSEAPQANVGDSLGGDVDGVLDYDFGNYKLYPTETPEVTDGGLEREVTEDAGDATAVATYNLENLNGADDAEAFERHAEYIATNLASPDIVALEEIQDNNGAEDDGTVAADETLGRLVEAISAAGGPAYEHRQIDPENNADGGEPGGNIRVGFLYNPETAEFNDKEGGDATTPVEVDSEGLSHSPGRVDPGNEAWDQSRKPLAGEFTVNGEQLFVVANHFASKGGDDPVFGRFQPPTRSTEGQRHQQAEVLNDFTTELSEAVPDANVVVAGDINDFEFSETVDILTAGDALSSSYDLVDEAERYSYVFDGNSQVLDQILTSPNLAEGAEYDVVHVNAEFVDQASDHDPSVIRLTL